jgi:hypothetical protein
VLRFETEEHMPQPHSRELEELERDLKDYQDYSVFPPLVKEYSRLLNILGNVDGDEIIALVLIALNNAGYEVSKIPGTGVPDWPKKK